MTTTIKMTLEPDKDFGSPTRVEFVEISDPLTTDDLVWYLLRFGLACGYSLETLIRSMVYVAYENGFKDEE